MREELSGLGTADPTYEQLTNDLPYLDAVTREVLRLHAPVAQTTRVVRVFTTPAKRYCSDLEKRKTHLYCLGIRGRCNPFEHPNHHALWQDNR